MHARIFLRQCAVKRAVFAIGVVIGIEHAEGGCHNLFRTDSRYESHVEFPTESLWREYRFHGLAYHSYITLLLLLTLVERVVVGEIAQCPHHDTCHEDYSSHLFQILLALLPSVAADGLPCRETIGRQLHDERSVLALEHKLGENLAHDDGHDDAREIQQHHYQRLVFHGEECAYYHDVDRYAGLATHKRQYEHRYQSAATALDGACCHDGRHIASETHDERNERLAVESHLVHQTVHDECRARHISAVLHE